MTWKATHFNFILASPPHVKNVNCEGGEEIEIFWIIGSSSKKYLKKWLNIPSHGASDIAIFHPYLLNIKTPSQLYIEGHAGNYTLMRIKGDDDVNHTLDSRLERESAWVNKSSTIVQCHQLLEQNIENDNIFIPTPFNCPDVIHARRHEIPRAKKSD